MPRAVLTRSSSGPRALFSPWGHERRSGSRAHGRRHQERGFETADVRHHLAPRRGEDDDDREAASLWRRDPSGGFGQELAAASSNDERLDGDRAPAWDLDFHERAA